MPPLAFPDLSALAIHLRQELESKKVVLLYAYNGTGKTRLSMEFRQWRRLEGNRDTLYFNAYTEDLFQWKNEDGDLRLALDNESHFFDGLFDLEMDNRIRPLLQRYADFDFRIDTAERVVRFARHIREYNVTTGIEALKRVDNIKVSRGEENLFIWCFFLAVVELAMDPDIEAYRWVKYLYIDDPISSLDEHNAIAVGSHLAQILGRPENRLKAVLSSHHPLFFNVMHNELDARKSKVVSAHFLGRSATGGYSLSHTGATPFFHHVALLTQLYQADQTGELYTYHFSLLRSVLEKSASFHGFSNFSACLVPDEDDPDGILHARLINILSHGNYSLFEPQKMLPENKAYFRKILHGFLQRYPFNPEVVPLSAEEVPT